MSMHFDAFSVKCINTHNTCNAHTTISINMVFTVALIKDGRMGDRRVSVSVLIVILLCL